MGAICLDSVNSSLISVVGMSGIGRPIVTCVDFDAKVRSTYISPWLLSLKRDAYFCTHSVDTFVL